jgi:anaerobic magnesium-protoporphyrin IX monomethyl ester cyclase
MHVLLVGPDLEENLSLRYLASSLRRAGHVPKIATFDSSADAERVVAASADAELIALSMCYQIRAPEFLALARALKALRPGRPVVAGGHFASCAARELLSEHQELDAIALHEGEQTLAEIASLGAFTPEALSRVSGIVHRDRGEIVSTPPRAIVADLDSLPWPDRTGPARLMVGVPTAYVMGSRGCLYSCDYCCITTLHRLAEGKRFRQRSTDNIAEEMAWLYHERGVRQFIFHDDNFLVPSVDRNLERIEALDREIRRRGVHHIGIVLKCRPAEVDRQVFERLREMGLLRVFLGIESGSTAGLASIGRRQTVDDEHRALRICEDLGISTQYTIILFHPEATAKTMLDDLAFVREHAGHPLSFCRAEIYAGTPLERRMIASSRALGGYLARTYRYGDPVVARVWSSAKELLVGRCFNEVNLMGQVIRLDHQAAVFRAFYDGRDVENLVREFAALELSVNLDTVALLEDLVRVCDEHRGVD